MTLSASILLVPTKKITPKTTPLRCGFFYDLEILKFPTLAQSFSIAIVNEKQFIKLLEIIRMDI